MLGILILDGIFPLVVMVPSGVLKNRKFITHDLLHHVSDLLLTLTVLVTGTLLNGLITSTVGGDGGCRVSEVRAGTTSPMPDHKGFKLQ